MFFSALAICDHLLLWLLDPGEANAKGAKNLLVTLGRIWEIPSYHFQLPPPMVKANHQTVPMPCTWPMLPWLLPQNSRTALLSSLMKWASLHTKLNCFLFVCLAHFSLGCHHESMETGPEEKLTNWNNTEKSALLSNTEALLSGQPFTWGPLFSNGELFSIFHPSQQSFR